MNQHKPRSVLTKRETLIVRILVQGYTTKAVAEKLKRSHATIRTHTNSIYRKLGVHNRIGLADWARYSLRPSPPPTDESARSLEEPRRL